MEKLLFCIDNRRLNEKIIPRKYPIPRTEDLLEKMKGAKYFTVLDPKNGYFKIPLREGDEETTALFVGEVRLACNDPMIIGGSGSTENIPWIVCLLLKVCTELFGHCCAIRLSSEEE